MARVRKYLKGEPFASVADVVADLEAGRYVMVYSTPMHPSWPRNWSVQTLIGFFRRGAFVRAEINPLWTPPKEIEE